VIDSLQLTAKHKVATPVNWKQGEDVIIAGSVSDDDAKKIYPQGWKAPRPYIRIVPQPKAEQRRNARIIVWRMRGTTWRVAALLFVSGLCALVYQVAWLREFRLIFGASTAASAAVLAIFMEDSALGESSSAGERTAGNGPSRSTPSSSCS